MIVAQFDWCCAIVAQYGWCCATMNFGVKLVTDPASVEEIQPLDSLAKDLENLDWAHIG